MREDLEGRVYPFAVDSAEAYADIVIARERRGRPMSVLDAQIAAICRCRGASLATRTGATSRGLESRSWTHGQSTRPAHRRSEDAGAGGGARTRDPYLGNYGRRFAPISNMNAPIVVHHRPHLRRHDAR